MMEAQRVLRLRESKSVVTGFILMFHLIRTDRFVFYKIGGESLFGLGMGRSFGLNQAELFLAYDRDLVHQAKELRKHPTVVERKRWDDYLRTFPHRVLRPRPIDHFIVDFYCAALRLVIEVDGEIHDSERSQVYDQ